MRGLLLRANFALTDTLPLKNGTFLTKIPSSQNLKVAIYKGFKIVNRNGEPSPVLLFGPKAGFPHFYLSIVSENVTLKVVN